MFGQFVEDGCRQDGAQLDGAGFVVRPGDSIFYKFPVDFPHRSEVLQMGVKVLVEMGAAPGEEMDVEGVASLEVSPVEKGFTFLEQEIVGGRTEDDFFRFACDGLFDDLGFQNTPGDSGEINAEERLAVRKNPVFDEAGGGSVIAEFKLAQAERVREWLDAGPDYRLDFVCGRESGGHG